MVFRSSGDVEVVSQCYLIGSPGVTGCQSVVDNMTGDAMLAAYIGCGWMLSWQRRVVSVSYLVAPDGMASLEQYVLGAASLPAVVTVLPYTLQTRVQPVYV